MTTSPPPTTSAPVAPPASLAEAREQFAALVDSVRPELHRYSARLTGSVIEGEDIVQETLAKAFYAMSLSAEMPPLRPWLFRIAHNAAIDFMRSHGRKVTDPTDDIDTLVTTEALEGNPANAANALNPAVVRSALSRFLSLPLTQRSAVILKDVLGHSLEETAETMGTTVMAVKAALVRGRARLREEESKADDEEEAADKARAAKVRADLNRYASCFNARDWDGVRALVSDDCKLDLVSKSQRQGKAVGMYFGRYEKENIVLRVMTLEGHEAPILAAFKAGTDPEKDHPSYVIVIEWTAAGEVSAIRDFKYINYITKDATFT